MRGVQGGEEVMREPPQWPGEGEEGDLLLGLAAFLMLMGVITVGLVFLL